MIVSDGSEKPLSIPFESIIHSTAPNEVNRHIRKLMEAHKHNYLAIFGGRGSGVESLNRETILAVSEYLISIEPKLQNKSFGLQFINSSLSKNKGTVSFSSPSSHSQAHKEQTVALSQLQSDPELIKRLLRLEAPRTQSHSSNQRESSFVTFSFLKEKDTHSVSILVLRNFKKDERMHEPPFQKMVLSAIGEFRQMIGSSFIGQERIENLVKHNLEKSKQSIFLCVSPTRPKIHETVLTLAVYQSFMVPIEKRITRAHFPPANSRSPSPSPSDAAFHPAKVRSRNQNEEKKGKSTNNERKGRENRKNSAQKEKNEKQVTYATKAAVVKTRNKN